MLLSIVSVGTIQADDPTPTPATSASPAPTADAVTSLPLQPGELSPATAPEVASVFTGSKFPDGLFREEAVMRDGLRNLVTKAPVTVAFYNDQFQKVPQADKPGRYGAVFQIRGAGGSRFSTIYRLPDSLPEHPELGITKDSITKASFAESARMAILLAGLSESTTPAATPEAARADAWARDAAWWGRMREQLHSEPEYQYLVDLPVDYDKDPNKRWPLILFLHGSGERGNDLKKVRDQGLAKVLATGNKFPAVIISPQCPANEWWQSCLLVKLLNDVTAKYRVDADRTYLTGISMGGFGSWALGLACPERFAAVAPVCGGSDLTDAARLKDIPLWAFHGQEDKTVPVTNTINMVAAIRQAGGHPHDTLYPGVGHGCWHLVYDTDAFYTWLFAQKLGQPEVVTPGLPVP
jgi:predicted esterase